MKAVPLRCVFFLFLSGAAEGRDDGGSGGSMALSFPSKNNEIFIRGLNFCDEPTEDSRGGGPPLRARYALLGARLPSLRGGGAAALNPLPAGYHPFGYGLTDIGREYLEFDGSLDSDVGRFLSTLKGDKRKTAAVLKEQWLEILRVSKKAQSLRVYRRLDDLIAFCLKAGFID